MEKIAGNSQLHIPVIDISALTAGTQARHEVAARIGQACREWGFFYIVGHGVEEHLQQRLESISQRFFAQDLETKLEIGMSRGGSAWRGYFPVGGELTSGRPDLKEGIYFGAELRDDHPLVKAGTPLHGPNLFPFFFDPNFGAEVRPIETGAEVNDNPQDRWDRASVHEFRGTYGDYLSSKVSKVFPELRREVL
jgi:isopenicillin N synthase-like dioxygenase